MGSLKKKKNPDEFLNDGSDSNWDSTAILYVNGVRKVLPDGLAHFTLLEYLRDVGMTGTKLGCGEGGCGACTVMGSYYDKEKKKTMHYAINACLAPLYSLEGMHVITVEGLGNSRSGLHPIQESLVRSHGSQCGFCTPGFLMSMYALLRSNQTPPSQEQIEECLAGNLCRCTGYRAILDAFKVFAKKDDTVYMSCSSTGKTCTCTPTSCENASEKNEACSGFNNGYQPISYDSTDGSKYVEKELIFPPELALREFRNLILTGTGGLKWFRPVTVKVVLSLKSIYPNAKLIVGNSEVGVEMRLKKIEHKIFIAVMHVPELNILNVNPDGIEIGSATRLSDLMTLLRQTIAERPGHETSACQAFLGQLKWFAGTQIRNVGSIGGNICTASPISDLNPLWMAARAEFKIIDSKGNVRTTMAEDFFLGYRKVELAGDEILLSVLLPWTRKHEFVQEFKQAHRRDDDIAIVNAGMRVYLEERNENWIVADAFIAYGGVAAVSLPAKKTKAILIGRSWDHSLLSDALSALQKDVLLKDDAPGGMVEFRKSLTLSFFFKFFIWVSNQMEGEKFNKQTIIPQSHLSAIQSSHNHTTITSAKQDYEIIKRGTAVGSSHVHLSSKLQATGEAEYTDDTPLPPNALHAALVLSTKPHARLLSIDDTEIKSLPGFVGMFLAKDVPNENTIGTAVMDEEVFATELVTCVGHVIGIVVADTHEHAKLAARKVKVEYEELPAILSIKDAIEANSFHPNTERCLTKGDVDLCFKSSQCDRIIEGEVRVAGQEHFYFEPNSSLVWTVDNGHEVHMISSTQDTRKHQAYVARVLGLPLSKVVCKTKRIGGGFGGKETRSSVIAAVVCVPAYLLNRPVKITLDRDTDMMITGHRHSFVGKYKVGFTNDGKLQALDLKIYNNGGNTLDLSCNVLERGMFQSDNVYDIPNMRIKGRVCFTHLPSNTAFRGIGGPQGMLIAENWIERIAVELNKPPEEIREMNLQYENYMLHHGEALKNCKIGHVWRELKLSCDFSKARQEVDHFNSKNRWKKRGIAMVPTKFGISFPTKFLNQASSLVHIYTDGTVLVSHGGVEMGQGLHTKMAQIAASVFNIPLTSVFISETSTDKVPNSSASAASASSDLYGAAVLNACEQLKARMDPIASSHNFKSFAELVMACYLERVDLSAHGFHVVPDIGFDWNTGEGQPFIYYTYGAAFAEVEIDTLTGDFHTRTADIFLDLGYSLNPAIDIGQIEGAFIQGLGWVALEELKWGDGVHKWIPPGCLYTCGPGTYKLPSVNDVPRNFNVSLLKGHPNPQAVHSSKGVGEPPLFLATSVLFAIKDAIRAARGEVGCYEWFPLENPATPERIRMACFDEFISQFVGSDFRPKLSI